MFMRVKQRSVGTASVHANDVFQVSEHLLVHEAKHGVANSAAINACSACD